MVEAAQLSMGGWIYKMWSVSAAEEHLPVERNELCVAIWINLGNIMLRERSQAQVIHTWYNSTNTKGTVQVHPHR